MSSSQAHDPALSSANSAQVPLPPSGASQPSSNVPSTAPGDFQTPVGPLDPSQILSLLKMFPKEMFKPPEQGTNPKEDAAQTLSNLSQASFPPPPPPAVQGTHPQMHHYLQAAAAAAGVTDPGPSSHPRGPPNLGQLSAAAAAGAAQGHHHHQQQQQQQQDDRDDGVSDGDDDPTGPGGLSVPMQNVAPASASAGSTKNGGGGPSRTRGRAATMGTDEWTRQRKDNHKEVERRRRGNINEGINELGRIVPNGSGEKAKGAILSRAVQYIHHLKENEARNIEKWTLEKLLMDQAMGDLQTQLEEMRRHWEEERSARQRAEAELDVLRGLKKAGAAGGATGRSRSPDEGGVVAGKRRAGDVVDQQQQHESQEEQAKRTRVD